MWVWYGMGYICMYIYINDEGQNWVDLRILQIPLRTEPRAVSVCKICCLTIPCFLATEALFWAIATPTNYLCKRYCYNIY